MKYKVWDKFKKDFNDDILVNQDGSLFHYIKSFDGRSLMLSAELERYQLTWFSDNLDEIEVH